MQQPAKGIPTRYLYIEICKGQGGLILAAGGVSSKFEILPHPKHTAAPPPRLQQPGGRDHVETAYPDTSPTLGPKLARLCRHRVCGNRSHTALAIRYLVPVILKYREAVTHRQYTDRKTNKITKACTHVGTKRVLSLLI